MNGPPIKDPLTGNIRNVFADKPEEWHHLQTRQYGSTYRIRGFGGSDQLYIADPETLKHVLSKRSYQYTKPKQLGPFQGLFGDGIIFVEGRTHARQRRIIQSAFQQKAVDGYISIFESVADEVSLGKRQLRAARTDFLAKLCRHLELLCAAEVTTHAASGVVVDMLDWLSRTTLRIIGLAGFDYAIDSLNHQEASPLVQAMELLTAPTAPILAMQLLGHYFPLAQRLPLRSVRLVEMCRETIARESAQIIDRRAQLAEKDELHQKEDLMSLLYRANMETQLPRDMMSKSEMSAQIATFVTTFPTSKGCKHVEDSFQLLAGNETSSTSLSWMVNRLVDHPEIQDRLHSEIASKGRLKEDGAFSFATEDLDELQFLDGFVVRHLECILVD